MTPALETSRYKPATSTFSETFWLGVQHSTSRELLPLPTFAFAWRFCKCCLAYVLSVVSIVHDHPLMSRNTATITLTPSLTTPVPVIAEVGTKVFAVVGGSAQLFTMPGGGGTPAWVRLTRTAPIGSNRITLDTLPTGWPIGGEVRSLVLNLLDPGVANCLSLLNHCCRWKISSGLDRCLEVVKPCFSSTRTLSSCLRTQIVISSTDFDALLSEVRTIVGINGSDVILDKPLIWEHWGKPVYTGVGDTYLPQVRHFSASP